MGLSCPDEQLGDCPRYDAAAHRRGLSSATIQNHKRLLRLPCGRDNGLRAVSRIIELPLSDTLSTAERKFKVKNKGIHCKKWNVLKSTLHLYYLRFLTEPGFSIKYPQGTYEVYGFAPTLKKFPKIILKTGEYAIEVNYTLKNETLFAYRVEFSIMHFDDEYTDN